MSIEIYRLIRSEYKDLTYEMLKEPKVDGYFIKRVANRFGLISEGSLIMKSEEETNLMMDYIIYEKNGESQNVVQRYEKRFGDTLEGLRKQVLDGMLRQHYSVFQVKEINRTEHTLLLLDLLNNEEFILRDSGFSLTGSLGLIVATRLIPINGLHITSGMSLAFAETQRLRILNALFKERSKKRRKSTKKLSANKRNKTRTKLEILYELHLRHGIQVITRDPS